MGGVLGPLLYWPPQHLARLARLAEAGRRDGPHAQLGTVLAEVAATSERAIAGGAAFASQRAVLLGHEAFGAAYCLSSDHGQNPRIFDLWREIC